MSWRRSFDLERSADVFNLEMVLMGVERQIAEGGKDGMYGSGAWDVK